MTEYQNPEFKRLYDAYANHEHSIGVDFRAMASKKVRSDPLVVATATTMAIYPGDGAPPSLLPFRKTMCGFNELAAVSHLGPAVGSLVAMRLAGNGCWQANATMLRERLSNARLANSSELWRDRIAVDAYRGREEPIAEMLDYGCALTDRLLATALEDADFLRRTYPEASDDALGATVSFNQVMIATFFLVGMDIAYRANCWFATNRVDWQRAMVLTAGQQGRPTAGVTLCRATRSRRSCSPLRAACSPATASTSPPMRRPLPQTARMTSNLRDGLSSRSATYGRSPTPSNIWQARCSRVGPAMIRRLQRCRTWVQTRSGCGNAGD